MAIKVLARVPSLISSRSSDGGTGQDQIKCDNCEGPARVAVKPSAPTRVLIRKESSSRSPSSPCSHMSSLWSILAFGAASAYLSWTLHDGTLVMLAPLRVCNTLGDGILTSGATSCMSLNEKVPIAGMAKVAEGASVNLSSVPQHAHAEEQRSRARQIQTVVEGQGPTECSTIGSTVEVASPGQQAAVNVQGASTEEQLRAGGDAETEEAAVEREHEPHGATIEHAHSETPTTRRESSMARLTPSHEALTARFKTHDEDVPRFSPLPWMYASYASQPMSPSTPPSQQHTDDGMCSIVEDPSFDAAWEAQRMELVYQHYENQQDISLSDVMVTVVDSVVPRLVSAVRRFASSWCIPQEGAMRKCRPNAVMRAFRQCRNLARKPAAFVRRKRSMVPTNAPSPCAEPAAMRPVVPAGAPSLKRGRSRSRISQW